MIYLPTPTQAILEGYDDRIDALKKEFTFTDKAAVYAVQRFKKAHWFLNKFGEEAWTEKLNELKAKQQVCLIKEEKGKYVTHAGIAKLIAEKYQDKVELGFEYPEPSPMTWYNQPKFDLRYYQKESVKRLEEVKHGAISAATGCHRKGERVLMFNGSIKKVEDVVIGDKLMGPDSLPREVLELCRGKDKMYKITAINGQEMYVNGEHILSLYKTPKTSGPKFNCEKTGFTEISVNNYLNQSKWFKHLHKLHSTGVEFVEKELPLDPYFLGLLIGDGAISGVIQLTTMDSEIVEEIYNQADIWNLNVRKYQKPENRASDYFLTKKYKTIKENPLISVIRDIGLFGKRSEDKFIPKEYLINSRKNRLAILAGLMDTDGHLADGYFDYITKSRELAEDVAFLSRSLGFRVKFTKCKKRCQNGFTGDYFRLSIAGEVSEIPTRLPRKQAPKRQQIKKHNVYGFDVELISENEDYYGFILDKDHLYLTDTFLVTHNSGKSATILQLVKNYGLKTVVMAPTANIAEQLYKNLEYHLGSRYVGMFGNGRKKIDKKIVVAIDKSLSKVKKDSPEWGILSKTEVFIADESHVTAAETLEEVCMGLFANTPYRFFVSATQTRNDGSGILLNGVIGPVVYTITLKQLVDEGFLAKPNFVIVPAESDSNFYSQDVLKILDKHLYHNKKLHLKFAQMANKAAARGRQVLIMIDHVEQFPYLVNNLTYETKFAHGPLDKDHKQIIHSAYHKADNAKLVNSFNNREFPILVGTSCISIGTDILPVNDIFNLQGGSSPIKFPQLVGRGTRKVEGKNSFNFFDPDIKNVPTLHRQTMNRVEIYRNMYDNVRFL